MSGQRGGSGSGLTLDSSCVWITIASNSLVHIDNRSSPNLLRRIIKKLSRRLTVEHGLADRRLHLQCTHCHSWYAFVDHVHEASSILRSASFLCSSLWYQIADLYLNMASPLHLVIVRFLVHKFRHASNHALKQARRQIQCRSLSFGTHRLVACKAIQRLCRTTSQETKIMPSRLPSTVKWPFRKASRSAS